ncbi:hypothetical protein GCM10028774_27980 [Spirosoma jeollabukense]
MPILPWNGLSITTNFDPNTRHVENVATSLTGMTFPLSAQQQSYQEDAVTYTMNGPITTLTVVVDVTVNLFVEGIGSVYTTSYVLRGYIIPCPGGGSRTEFEELY